MTDATHGTGIERGSDIGSRVNTRYSWLSGAWANLVQRARGMAGNVKGLDSRHFLFAVGIFVAGQILLSAGDRIWPKPAEVQQIDQVELGRHLQRIDDRLCWIENKELPGACQR